MVLTAMAVTRKWTRHRASQSLIDKWRTAARQATARWLLSKWLPFAGGVHARPRNDRGNYDKTPSKPQSTPAKNL